MPEGTGGLGHDRAPVDPAPPTDVDPEEAEVFADDVDPASEEAGRLLDEDLARAVEEATALAAERDEYLETLRRVKAEFDNFKRRTEREREEAAARAGAHVAAELLPVLDACDAAVDHGATDVEPVRKSLLEVLSRAGLERMAPEGGPFDPNLHEAVMHEPGDGGESTVVEALRTGYLWKGLVLRPAMVKVRG